MEFKIRFKDGKFPEGLSVRNNKFRLVYKRKADIFEGKGACEMDESSISIIQLLKTRNEVSEQYGHNEDIMSFNMIDDSVFDKLDPQTIKYFDRFELTNDICDITKAGNGYAVRLNIDHIFGLVYKNKTNKWCFEGRIYNVSIFKETKTVFQTLHEDKEHSINIFNNVIRELQKEKQLDLFKYIIPDCLLKHHGVSIIDTCTCIAEDLIRQDVNYNLVDKLISEWKKKYDLKIINKRLESLHNRYQSEYIRCQRDNKVFGYTEEKKFLFDVLIEMNLYDRYHDKSFIVLKDKHGGFSKDNIEIRRFVNIGDKELLYINKVYNTMIEDYGHRDIISRDWYDRNQGSFINYILEDNFTEWVLNNENYNDNFELDRKSTNGDFNTCNCVLVSSKKKVIEEKPVDYLVSKGYTLDEKSGVYSITEDKYNKIRKNDISKNKENSDLVLDEHPGYLLKQSKDPKVENINGKKFIFNTDGVSIIDVYKSKLNK